MCYKVKLLIIKDKETRFFTIINGIKNEHESLEKAKEWLSYNGYKNYKVEKGVKRMKKKYIDTDDVSLMNKEYVHENELEVMITRLWDEIYNHEPFTPYDENYLKSLYSDLFKFDREDTWLINNVLIIEYDLWTKAYNEHFLIINLIGRIGAYIEEPFDYIDTLYKPFSDDEKEKYMKEWGAK